MKKAMSIILTALIVLALSSSIVFGASATFNLDNVKPDFNNTNSVQNIGMKIVGIIQVIGTIAAVAVLIILGIKYMMGSAEEKAEYKKTLLPYFIGAILIFAAVNVAKIIYGWAIGING